MAIRTEGVLWIGIGCNHGTSRALIEYAVHEVLRSHHLTEHAIAGIATIDSKANETGLVEFCRDRNLPLRCFSAEALRSVTVPHPSAVVEAEIGTPSVAEAAAILSSREWGVGSRETPHTPHPTPHTPSLRIPKQIIRQKGQLGVVTIAVAQSNQA